MRESSWTREAFEFIYNLLSHCNFLLFIWSLISPARPLGGITKDKCAEFSFRFENLECDERRNSLQLLP